MEATINLPDIARRRFASSLVDMGDCDVGALHS